MLVIWVRVTSTEFTILDGENISRSGCKFDDKDGDISVFRIVDGNKKIVYENKEQLIMIKVKLL